MRRSTSGHVVLSGFGDRRDRQRFAAAYADPESGVRVHPDIAWAKLETLAQGAAIASERLW